MVRLLGAILILCGMFTALALEHIDVFLIGFGIMALMADPDAGGDE